MIIGDRRGLPRGQSAEPKHAIDTRGSASSGARLITGVGNDRNQGVAMSESWVGIVMGSFVLLIASIFMANHYRREHRRRQLLRNMDHSWWNWTRH